MTRAKDIGLEITILDFFTSPLFDHLEQEIR